MSDLFVCLLIRLHSPAALWIAQHAEPRVTVAMDPSVLLHQHGISLDQLSDPSSVVAQAAQAIIANFDSMMHASDDDAS